MYRNVLCTVVLFFAGVLLNAALPGGVRASGYEFDGVGARAIARGGAVISDANDWTAVYWNPAGLVSAPRQAGLELRAGRMYSKDANSFNIPGVSPSPFGVTRTASGFVIGSLGAVVPLNDKSAIGAGVYTPLLQGSDFKDTSPASFAATSLDYKSQVVAGVANVSYARKLSDKLSGGLGVNVIYGALGSDSTIVWGAAMPAGLANNAQKNKAEASGYGVEGVGGLTYALSDNWTAGAVLRSGARIALKGEEKVYINGAFLQKSDFSAPVHHPATSGVGVSWQARRDLKLSCDIAQVWWKGFTNRRTYETPGGLLNSNGNTYHWFNSVKFRFGALKSLDERTELLAGYAFDTWAIDRRSVDFSTAIDVPMHRFSAAVTKKWTPVEATVGALAGSGRRTSGGVDYSVRGWYVIGEAKYRF